MARVGQTSVAAVIGAWSASPGWRRTRVPLRSMAKIDGATTAHAPQRTHVRESTATTPTRPGNHRSIDALKLLQQDAELCLRVQLIVRQRAAFSSDPKAATYGHERVLIGPGKQILAIAS